MTDQADLQDIRDLLRGLVALAVDERERRIEDPASAKKSEVLLSDAGLSTLAIAEILGKNPDAVRKTLSRARSRT